MSEQVALGAMPPKGSPKPSADATRTTLGWIKAEIARVGGPVDRTVLPKFGNAVDHAVLFGTPAPAVTPVPPRIWRMRPEIYQSVFMGSTKGLIQPFDKLPESGFKDFAGAFVVGEPTAELLIANAEKIVEYQTAPPPPPPTEQEKRKPVKQAVPTPLEAARFPALADPKAPPTPARVEEAVRKEFALAAGRAPTAAEVERYMGFYRRNAEGGKEREAAKTTLMAVLLVPGAIFRPEFGSGAEVAPGVRMLSPTEIAHAVSFALGNARDPALYAAAANGGLTTRDEVADHVRRTLGLPMKKPPPKGSPPTAKGDASRLPEFFREFFGYRAALDVFKNAEDNPNHDAAVLVNDTDLLLAYVLRRDKDVFRELLTTNKSFVQYSGTGPAGSKTADKKLRPVWTAYGLPADWKYVAAQPIELPKEQRAGILTQPSWLVAHSSNAENDPVRRGKWVRERLLGGAIPDIPINADAQIPDDPARTLRDRLTGKTADGACWRCHKQMNPLGLPFERFDHFGRFRTTEAGKTVDATGAIDFSGDPHLDGPVADPVAMIHKLAGSERVRQVFVRHAFRFFLGRNETPGDARTLQDADKAYVESGGSYKALVLSLLTSDSFLCRAAAPPAR